MFGNEMSGARVETSGQEGAHEEVHECVSSHGLVDDDVECDLHNNVEEMEFRHWDLEDHHGTESVEEDLESCEECLSENRIQEDGFKTSWKIGVESLNSESLVVNEMVRLLFPNVSLTTLETQSIGIVAYPE